MIAEERVKKMSQLAVYEKKIGQDPFLIYEYSLSDFIGKETLKNFVEITIAYIIGLLCLVAFNIEYLLDHCLEMDYENIGLWLVVSYGTIVLITTIVTVVIAKKKYNREKKKIEKYIQILDEVCLCYEKEREE